MELIKNFMYKCPLCNTGVQFEVPELVSVSKVLELSEAINKLICPKCGKSLGEDAKKAFDTVKAYNEASQKKENPQNTLGAFSFMFLQIHTTQVCI